MTNTEKVLKTVDMAMKVNETTKCDVFIYISPHVESLDASIYTCGWKLGADPDMQYRGHYKNIPNGILIDDRSVGDIWTALEKILEEGAQ